MPSRRPPRQSVARPAAGGGPPTRRLRSLAVALLAAGCLAAGCAAPADHGYGSTGDGSTGDGSTGDGSRRDDTATAALAHPTDGAVEATDDAGNVVRLARPARRVLSLVPSGTEMVAALAGAERLVGRTRYDDDPALAALPTVGGGMDPSLEAIVALRPDLVLVWESEAQGTLRGQLGAAGVPTFALQSSDTADVFSAMARLGRLLGRDAAAAALAARVRGQLDSVRLAVAGRPVPSVLYVVGVTPAMTAGTGTFVIELLGVAGGRSAFPDIRDGWPTLSLEEIVSRDPDIVLLPVSDDPTVRVSTVRRTAGWRELRAVRQGHVATVSANLVNRPGPRMGEAAAALARAIHDR